MEKKLPGVFPGKVKKNCGNNKQVFYSNKEEKEVSNEDRGAGYKKVKNVNQKISEIFNSSNYVYKADVEIKLKSGTFNKRVVGRNSTHLITMENELIPIADIIDIRRK